MKNEIIKTKLFLLLAISILVVNCSKDNIEGTSSDFLTGELQLKSSPVGDVVGKITVGYQGWFACTNDGSPINAWWHWSHDWSQSPSPDNTAIKSWPDVRDYTTTFQTDYPNLNNGESAKLFSSYTQQTVETQFLWMQQNGIDCAALQRFNPNGTEGGIRDAMALKVKNAAEAYDRKFYIMYDVSGWTNMQSEIKTDWINKMQTYTSSSAYAVQNGKPVVCIWGFGFNDNNHPWSASVCLDVINWFKTQGCYVIGGVPTHWRAGTSDSRSGFIDTYHALNMISPWMVGRISDASGSDWFYNNVNMGDQSDCDANGVDYQPCVLPGDLQEGQRSHGDFMWRQFYNMVRVGCQGIYISMFDEYNEGNQIAKTATDASWVPAGSGIKALDEDGTWCSSDYYLRLTNDGGRMLKGEIALTSVRPTLPDLNNSGGGGIVKKLIVGNTISFRAQVNDNYVGVTSDSLLIANRTEAGEWEKYIVVDAGNGNIALRSIVSSLYVCAEDSGISPLIANRTELGEWESFTEVDAGGGKIALLAIVNSSYVCVEDGGASALIANRDEVGNWETFTVTTYE